MLRDYQQRTIDQLYAWFNANATGNPCLVLPTVMIDYLQSVGYCVIVGLGAEDARRKISQFVKEHHEPERPFRHHQNAD